MEKSQENFRDFINIMEALITTHPDTLEKCRDIIKELVKYPEFLNIVDFFENLAEDPSTKNNLGSILLSEDVFNEFLSKIQKISDQSKIIGLIKIVTAIYHCNSNISRKFAGKLIDFVIFCLKFSDNQILCQTYVLARKMINIIADNDAAFCNLLEKAMNLLNNFDDKIYEYQVRALDYICSCFKVNFVTSSMMYDSMKIMKKLKEIIENSKNNSFLFLSLFNFARVLSNTTEYSDEIIGDFVSFLLEKYLEGNRTFCAFCKDFFVSLRRSVSNDEIFQNLLEKEKFKGFIEICNEYSSYIDTINLYLTMR
ncbi:hypothetical protein TVAG_421490 [Trichomonas vaginalis G3]|uniref:Uncharacterized protein n=1 Tax=Trichomonas vaginalis (strain ATCC PRA-98 / G3) TaxID=412133 RepID=A2FR36_TRIV3|nr:armadillo (ARM) repeat-containing protein family [Trichomonas vaginalis G3]EAX92625.1 hypothetical protein TVAG_421490 [Trichomonas vaginalis G3]KAI5540135.1 armadillo (ARM) repeat-containing protein family [Trichomonas vaginalis G3]|eukprot:XP_001305555.1 hypothetical protein [Trichomonas vaginalis G3]